MTLINSESIDTKFSFATLVLLTKETTQFYSVVKELSYGTFAKPIQKSFVLTVSRAENTALKFWTETSINSFP